MRKLETWAEVPHRDGETVGTALRQWSRDPRILANERFALAALRRNRGSRERFLPRCRPSVPPPEKRAAPDDRFGHSRRSGRVIAMATQDSSARAMAQQGGDYCVCPEGTVSWLAPMAALLAEQKTTEPDDELLRFVQSDSWLRVCRIARSDRSANTVALAADQRGGKRLHTLAVATCPSGRVRTARWRQRRISSIVGTRSAVLGSFGSPRESGRRRGSCSRRPSAGLSRWLDRTVPLRRPRAPVLGGALHRHLPRGASAPVQDSNGNRSAGRVHRRSLGDLPRATLGWRRRSGTGHIRRTPPACAAGRWREHA